MASLIIKLEKRADGGKYGSEHINTVFYLNNDMISSPPTIGSSIVEFNISGITREQSFFPPSENFYSSLFIKYFCPCLLILTLPRISSVQKLPNPNPVARLTNNEYITPAPSIFGIRQAVPSPIVQAHGVD